MSNTFKNGSVRIANETLEVIAKSSAEEVFGVYNPTSTFVDKDKLTEAKIQFINSKINVFLEIVLVEDVNVRDTIKKVQENVKKQLEIMTGLTVSKVNVSVKKLVIL